MYYQMESALVMIHKSKRWCLFLMLTTSQFTACEKTTDPHTAFRNGDYERSFQLWKSMAQTGDLEALNFLGMHYHLGFGVNRDIRKALELYQQSAQAGHAGAQNNLGMLYLSDKLGSPDFETAYVWLFAAYQQGNENARKGLDSIAGQLSPNRVQILKQRSLQYIKHDVTDPENDDY